MPTPTPTPAPTSTPIPTPTPISAALSLSYDEVQVGDHVFFGHYEQDADESNGKEAIEWRVLDKQDGRVLVISEYGLDCQLYHKERKKITWEESSLRTWLNNNFLNAAFTQAEQDAIPTVRVAYDQADEAYTLDQVFLLSADEAKTYFKSDADRRCDTTAYADKQGVRKWGEGYAYWPLRAYGSSQYAGGCDASGKVHGMGNAVNDDVNAVRPAMWIELLKNVSSEAQAWSVHEEVVRAAYALASGESMTESRQLHGEVVSIDTPWSRDHKNITVTIQVGELADMPIMCYRLTGSNAEYLKVGDKITVEGILKNYNGTIEFDKGCKLLGDEAD